MSIVVLPDYLSQSAYRVALIGEFYFMMLIAQSIGMCATLLYSKMVFEATSGKYSREDLDAMVSSLGGKIRR